MIIGIQYLTLGAEAGIILLVTWLVAWVARVAVRRLMVRSQPLMASQAGRTAWTIVWLVGGILVVEQLGINSDILLLVVGLLGVAAILALRPSLENLAARYFADIYLPFKVGDSLSVEGTSGRVLEINPMSTILLAADDTLHSVPNAVLLTRTVVNTTPQAWKEVIVPIAIGSDVDLPAFESALLKSLNKMRLHLDERFPPFLATRSRTPQTTELTLTIMIRRPGEREAVAMEANQRVAEVLSGLPGKRAAARPAPTA